MAMLIISIRALAAETTRHMSISTTNPLNNHS